MLYVTVASLTAGNYYIDIMLLLVGVYWIVFQEIISVFGFR